MKLIERAELIGNYK